MGQLASVEGVMRAWDEDKVLLVIHFNKTGTDLLDAFLVNEQALFAVIQFRLQRHQRFQRLQLLFGGLQAAVLRPPEDLQAAGHRPRPADRPLPRGAVGQGHALRSSGPRSPI